MSQEDLKHLGRRLREADIIRRSEAKDRAFWRSAEEYTLLFAVAFFLGMALWHVLK